MSKIGHELDNIYELEGKIWVWIEIFFTCEKMGQLEANPLK